MHNWPSFNPFFEAYEINELKQEPKTFQGQMNKLDRTVTKIEFLLKTYIQIEKYVYLISFFYPHHPTKH